MSAPITRATNLPQRSPAASLPFSLSSTKVKSVPATWVDRAELATEVDNLISQLATANTAQTTQAAAYAALQETLTQQAQQLDDAQARALAAEAEVQAATIAAAQVQAQAEAAAAAAPPGPPGELEAIPKPSAQRYNIREAMNLDDQEYLTIRATIHDLVKSAQLKWRDEFRHQDPAKLGHLFKAARKEHPVLRRYVGDWATAVIAKTYMQNMRKYARRRGYMPPWKSGGNVNNTNGSGAN
ncbi:hypothetical protein V8D89_008613 [Ganoderma adspersum]